ncbi:MAG: shikimate kinase [Candidatus Methanomethylophilaceae archaeon]|nr:shikimate kinase [Candidatus Methanomethylophilaceae archaeon]
MTGHGRSYGAITVINAMPCGIGATIGVDLVTNSVFDVIGDERKVIIKNDPSEDDRMARLCVSAAYSRMGIPEPIGWELEISSQIPVSRGLKSSSSACNSILSAIFDEHGFKIGTMDMIRIGVACARSAGVTVTGSFDDACGCHLGGFVMTDNAHDRLILHRNVGLHDVVIYVPDEKIRKKGLEVDNLRACAQIIRDAISISETDPFSAMTINGRTIASASGIDGSWAERALRYGALGAGVSGSGPAVTAVFDRGMAKEFIKICGSGCILTTTRDAKVLMRPDTKEGKERCTRQAEE